MHIHRKRLLNEPPPPGSVKKHLDRFSDIPYIHLMFILNLLTLKLALKAAWRRPAVAEGGFY